MKISCLRIQVELESIMHQLEFDTRPDIDMNDEQYMRWVLDIRDLTARLSYLCGEKIRKHFFKDIGIID